MKKEISKSILVGVVVAAMALPATVVMVGPGIASAANRAQYQTRSMNSTGTASQIQTRQRLRDGSCLTTLDAAAGTATKSGKAYGPGDGTGNLGVRPLDGTGYGAPANR